MMGKRDGAKGKHRDADVLDFGQAQEFLNTTRTTLYRWINQGRIRAFKAGRQWRLYKADLERFLRSPDPSAVAVSEDAIGKALAAVAKWQGAGAAAVEAGPEEEPIDLLARRTLGAVVHTPMASDIHLDPGRDGGRLRIRVDGVMHNVADLPRDVYRALLGRFKAMAGMDAADHATAQMGRIRETPAGDGSMDFVAQTLPAAEGEKLRLGLRPTTYAAPPFEGLSLSLKDRERLKTALARPTGVVIFGGPTGSGKTTVLYSAIQWMGTETRSVTTVESAVEYLLPGAVQVQTNPRGGLTVAHVLRSVLRADPDVVVVGEVPDRESAALAIEAGLSGHMVLVQMDADDAVGGIRRLLDAGTEPYLLAHSLLASVNQRLVRKVCAECRDDMTVDPDTLAVWRERAEAGGLEWPEAPSFVKGGGCEACRGTGYKGRTGIFEVLAVDPEIASLVARGADLREVQAVAIASGMTTLFADGMRRALDGLTSPVEVARVTDPAWMTV